MGCVTTETGPLPAGNGVPKSGEREPSVFTENAETWFNPKSAAYRNFKSRLTAMEVSPVGVANGLPETALNAPVAGLMANPEMVFPARFAAYRNAGVRRATVTTVVPVNVPLPTETVTVPGPRVLPIPIRPAELFNKIMVESVDDHFTVWVRF